MKKRGGRVRLAGEYAVFLCSLFLITSIAWCNPGPQNVLLLVNSESATSQYVAKMYRAYYPTIQNNQVVYLTGLADCSGPASTAADEIITRTTYNTCIAGPVRQHLLNNNLISQIMVIVTTAGMPYRIEDTVYPNVIYAAGSNYMDVANNLAYINAASVESELTCLWYSEYGAYPAGIDNRIVNPYQGYRQSSVSLFARAMGDSKPLHWETAITVTGVPPKMEGYIINEWPTITYGTINRAFHAGDMYLTCRLDGPKRQRQSAIFAVRKMLGRSKLASSASSGVNPRQAVLVLDDAVGKDTDKNRVYNLKKLTNYWVYDALANQPPDAPTIQTKDDYKDCYTSLTSGAYVANGLSSGVADVAWDACVLLDQRAGIRTNQNDLNLLVNNPALGRQEPQGLLALACYGMYNGDETITKEYLLKGGPGGGALFNPVNGAVFTSIESFNAVTLFSDAVTTHAKIVDFITIGGTGAIGHAFEPVSDAIVDNLFFFYNLVADENADGTADLCFAEAAFTGIPYLSWSEVVIGDPLMRLKYGVGQPCAWAPVAGDVNQDGVVNIRDYVYLRNLTMTYGNPGLYDVVPEKRPYYEDLCDLNQDGYNDIRDLVALRSILNIG